MARYSVRSAGFIGFLMVSVAAGAASGLQAAPQEVLPEDQITTVRVAELFRAALMKVTIDSDGDIIIEDGGMKTCIKLDASKKLITYFSVWPLKPAASELDKLKLVNRLNNQLIVTRFSVVNDSVLWCDYQLSYENGLTPYTIVNSYRVYAKVVKGAVSTQDPDDLIGTD